MATLESIRAKIARLQAQATELVAKDRAKVIGKIRDLMEQHALSIADIEAAAGRRRGRKAAANSAAKQASAAKAIRTAASKSVVKRAAAPARKSTKAKGDAKPLVSRKPRAAKSTLKSTVAVEGGVPQSAAELVSTPAA